MMEWDTFDLDEPTTPSASLTVMRVVLRSLALAAVATAIVLGLHL